MSDRFELRVSYLHDMLFVCILRERFVTVYELDSRGTFSTIACSTRCDFSMEKCSASRLRLSRDAMWLTLVICHPSPKFLWFPLTIAQRQRCTTAKISNCVYEVPRKTHTKLPPPLTWALDDNVIDTKTYYKSIYLLPRSVQSSSFIVIAKFRAPQEYVPCLQGSCRRNRDRRIHVWLCCRS